MKALRVIQAKRKRRRRRKRKSGGEEIAAAQVGPMKKKKKQLKARRVLIRARAKVKAAQNPPIVLVLEIGNGEKSGVDDQGLIVKVEVEGVERVILEAEAGEGRKLLKCEVQDRTHDPVQERGDDVNDFKSSFGALPTLIFEHHNVIFPPVI